MLARACVSEAQARRYHALVRAWARFYVPRASAGANDGTHQLGEGARPGPDGEEGDAGHVHEEVAGVAAARPDSAVEGDVERGLVRRVLRGHKLPMVDAVGQARGQVKLLDEVDAALDELPLVSGVEAVGHAQGELDEVQERGDVVVEGVADEKVVRGAVLVNVGKVLVGRQQRGDVHRLRFGD